MIKDLPQKLKILHNRYGFSQKQVAEKLGVSPSIVSAYETGERTPSAENLLSLSYLYNISTDYLLGKQALDSKLVLETCGLSDEQIKAILNLIETIREIK